MPAKKQKYNQIQLEKTADLFLEVAKTVILATTVGLLIPEVGKEVGLIGALIGMILSITCYITAMVLLRRVKK